LSQVAFAHALKIALLAKAELEIVHVQGHKIGNAKDVAPTKRRRGWCASTSSSPTTASRRGGAATS
jgi:hypothetical protein